MRAVGISSLAAMDPRRTTTRSLSIAAFACWLVLTLMQLAWIPFFSRAWGVNFWRYLPSPLGVGFALASLALCSGTVRERIADAAAILAKRCARVPLLLVAILVVAALWLLRSNGLKGDSALLLLKTLNAWFFFPETGGTFLMWSSVQLAKVTGHFGPSGAQLLTCVSGGIALLLSLQLGRSLAPEGRAGLAPAIVGLLASGGILRIFAGHVEVYPTLLVGVIAYLWLSLERIAGRRSWLAPSLALGIAVWLHASALLLVPSLAWLPWLAREGSASTSTRCVEAVRSVALAAVPVLAFLAVMALLGRREEFEQAFALALNILGIQHDPSLIRRWVQGFGEVSIGTDVSFLSWGQLKYLLNASFVLLPAALPCALWLALRAPSTLLKTPKAGFLIATCVPLLAYGLLLRACWGPFDWDLFSVGMFCFGCLLAHLLASWLTERDFRDLAVVVIGFQLLFVGVPFLLIGMMELKDAGPFAEGYFEFELHLERQPASPQLAPWL